MRKILFRAKHIHTLPQNEHLDGEWIFGYLCDENHMNAPGLEGELLIEPNTIGQYTGLKDKNGIEIYEGDIVKVEHEKYEKENEDDFSIFPEVVHYERNYSIEFTCKGGLCGYRCRNKSIHFPITPNVIYNHKIEVIGNIFDNQDLL